MRERMIIVLEVAKTATQLKWIASAESLGLWVMRDTPEEAIAELMKDDRVQEYLARAEGRVDVLSA